MTQIADKQFPPIPPLKMTWEEYHDWTNEEENRAEWVDGEVIFMSPAEDTHQFIAGWLYSLLNEFILSHDLGILLQAPSLMRLRTRPSGREPDLMFVAKENLHRNRRTYIDGPADLAVEIVSPESVERDRVTKLAEYEKGAVREYWLLDHRIQEALFYQLDDDGKYQLVGPDAQGIYHSRVLEGLWLKVDWLWQKPLPRLLEVMKAWNLV